MNYLELLNFIKNKAAKQVIVKQAEYGDPYKILARPDLKYPIVIVDIDGFRQDYDDDRPVETTYNTFIYYVDRTLHDNTNVKEIQSDACTTLLSLMNEINEELGSEPEGWNVTLFEQKFSDYCAGGYVLAELNVFNEMGSCYIEEFEPEEPTILEINNNGTFDVTDYKKVIVNVPSVTTEEITQAEYDELTEYDPYKIYLITE